MNKQEKIQLIRETGIIAIMRTRSSDQLIAAAEAIRQGGVQVIEVTMNTPGALEVINAAGKRFGQDVLFGAGTVLDPETAKTAIQAGADAYLLQAAVNPGLLAHAVGGVRTRPCSGRASSSSRDLISPRRCGTTAASKCRGRSRSSWRSSTRTCATSARPSCGRTSSRCCVIYTNAHSLRINPRSCTAASLRGRRRGLADPRERDTPVPLRPRLLGAGGKPGSHVRGDQPPP